MRVNNLGKLEVSGPQRIWLHYLSAKLDARETVSRRSALVELEDQLPRDFKPEDIDPRLLRNDVKITLLGICLIDPGSQIVKQTNQVLAAARSILKANPNVGEITADDITRRTSMPVLDAAKILEQLAHLPYVFHDSGTTYGSHGYLSMNIDEQAFDDYRRCETIEQVLEDILAAPGAEEQNTDAKEGKTMMEKRIIISHKETDKYFAKKLTYAVVASLDIPDKQVLCTSVEGHKLEFGPTTILEQLKQGVASSTVVIALITPDSIRADWVLIELGAAWVGSKTLIPVLAPGIDFGHLPGPFGNYRGIRADDPNATIHAREAMEKVSAALTLGLKPAGKPEIEWGDFIEALRGWKPTGQKNDNKDASDYSDLDYIATIEDWIRSSCKPGTVLIKFAKLDQELELPSGTASKFTGAAVARLNHTVKSIGTGTMTIEIEMPLNVSVTESKSAFAELWDQ